MDPFVIPVLQLLQSDLGRLTRVKRDFCSGAVVDVLLAGGGSQARSGNSAGYGSRTRGRSNFDDVHDDNLLGMTATNCVTSQIFYLSRATSHYVIEMQCNNSNIINYSDFLLK